MINLDHLVLDIETVPNPDVDCSMIEHQKDHPATCHGVIAISVMQITNTKVGSLKSCKPGVDDEKELLLDLIGALHSKALRDSVLTTWGGRYFDVPVLQWRCMHYGITAPRLHTFMGKRFNTAPHLDLSDHMSYFGSTRKPKMLHAAQAIGLPGKTGLDGSQVEGAYNEGRLQEIELYCCQDVLQTGIIYLRWLHVRGDVSTPSHNSLVKQALERGKERGIDVEGWEKRVLI
jgi:predicted PolB exonuclease-like 3'-5' exonuclease